MIDFLNYLPRILQIVAAIIAIIVFRENTTKFIFLLTLLMCIIVLVESLGVYFQENKINLRGYLYHVYSFFEYNIIALMYFNIIKKKRNRSVLKVIILVLNVFYLLSWFYLPIQLYVTPLGSMVVGVFLGLYLEELLQSDKILNYKKELPFWVTVGFMIFYLPSIPFFTMVKYMQNRGLFFVLSILVTLMNLFIIYGLLCSKKKI